MLPLLQPLQPQRGGAGEGTAQRVLRPARRVCSGCPHALGSRKLATTPPAAPAVVPVVPLARKLPPTRLPRLPHRPQVVCANLLFSSWARRAQPTVDLAIASADALSA